MYIEKKGNQSYLVKKVSSKKIGVIIQESSIITIDHLEALTNKEFEVLSTFKSYQDFKKNLYHPNLLDEVYKKSLLISNQSHNELYPTHFTQKYLDFPIRFIYESNKTEGSKIPLASVKQIIKEKKYTYKVKNEIIEVQNSLKVWGYIQREFVFNVGSMKRLYHLLTSGLLQENGLKYPRGFKKVPIIVNNNTTTPPEDVESEIKELLGEYKRNQKTKNPFQLAFDFHLKYEQIHPFENGNGRTGRFVLNKILLIHNLLPMIVFEENRQAYFNAIHSAHSGNKKKYYKFMLEQYAKTINEYWMKGED